MASGGKPDDWLDQPSEHREERDSGHRYTRLTEKAREIYYSSTEKFVQRLTRLQNEIEKNIFLMTNSEEKSDAISALEHSTEEFMKVGQEYTEYLERQNTEESEKELSSHKFIMKGMTEKVQMAFSAYTSTSVKRETVDVKGSLPAQVSGDTQTSIKSEKKHGSVKSSRKGSVKPASHASQTSRVSTTLSMKIAKAKGARVKLEYASREAEMLKQKAKIEAENLLKSADIEAKLRNLKAEEEVHVAEAEVNAMMERSDTDSSTTGLEETDNRVRTEQYVREQNTIFSHERHDAHAPENDRRPSQQELAADNMQSVIGAEMCETNHLLPSVNHDNGNVVQAFQANTTGNIQDGTSRPIQVNDSTHVPINNGMMDIVSYLTKQSFMPQRIEKFNEQSECYLSWKLTFKDVMTQIKASAAEELELLIHYLGRNSKLEVSSIKASNAGNSFRGLQKSWERLDSTYGSPEKVEHALKKKLMNVVKLPISYKNRSRLYELSDVLNEIQSVKEMPKYTAVFAYMDTSVGVQPVVNKLPLAIRNKWRERGLSLKRTTGVVFPPFIFFCNFIQQMAADMNDPGFDFAPADDSEEGTGRRPVPPRQVAVHKMSINESNSGDNVLNRARCFIHNNAGHPLEECRTFLSSSKEEKKELLRKHGRCFRCLDGKHLSRNCKVVVKCAKCGKGHRTIMHVEPENGGSHGGENVDSKCTKICGQFTGKSCAKIILANLYHKHTNHPPAQVYVILDEQSNHSLARTDLFDIFDPDAPNENYPLITCSGKVTAEGRRSSGFVISSLDGETTLDLPVVIECDKIPDNRQEIPTPDVAASFQHLKAISHLIPPLNPDATISLLIGRDLLPVHHIMEQKIGLPHEPFAQRTKLGWVIIGESCLDGHHRRSRVNVMKMLLRPEPSQPTQSAVMDTCIYNIKLANDDGIFQRTKEDNKVAMSIEDKEFLSVMENQMVKGEDRHWVAPLPFKKERQRLPNNRSQALDRARSLDQSLKKNPVKCGHFITFMQGLFEAGHAEQAPPLEPTDECWYLPLFGVYHPQKKDRIRGVFDSSAAFHGVSLNKVLMTGPDLMNSLQGVLMRFRRGKVAIMADIEQMFYCFRVHPDHRKYLRFIWHQNNNISEPLVDFQMKVHVFGNSPSPAVATYGLRKTAKEAEENYGSDTRAFVERNFYVDDALSSHPSPEEAIDLLRRTKMALMEHGGLRLHKIVSNSEDVLSAFTTDDLGKDVRNIELGKEDLPTQRSLGMCWNLEEDHFTFQVCIEDKPFTRRGVLSSINSLFDPLGFVAPVTIAGKAILREAMTSGCDWDEPLPSHFRDKWEKWKHSLQYLKDLRIPRTYSEVPLDSTSDKALYIFSDASEAAISAVAYVHFTSNSGNQQMGFMLGKAKLAPKHGHTIPRLELCAAVLATELYHTISTESDIDFQCVKFFTDSRVVLGYIHNQTKRFFTYVANRVERVRSCSKPQDWNYIPSKFNPADEGTRSVAAKDMKDSLWLNGPVSVFCDEIHDTSEFPLMEPDSEVRNLKTELDDQSPVLTSIQRLGSDRFARFSSWCRLVQAMALLKCFVSSRVRVDEKFDSRSREALRDAEEFVIRTVQNETFDREITALRHGNALPRDSTIRSLDPYLGDRGLLRVGGRLRHSTLTSLEKNPLIVPKRHHIAYLLILHFHELVKHQGRLITEGAIRSAGYWIVGVRRMIQSYLCKCVRCLKLRGEQQCPKMADLPQERLEPAPPFAYIGLDVFGPWTVVARKTRGGQAHHKRWAVIFTCLVIRAIHIEVIHEMTSSSFINALRRLVALRGEVKLIRSDCGTNFVGATKDLNANVIDVDRGDMKDFLSSKGITWKFNPPHASHMGGVWERLIGVSRRVLDSLLYDVTHLTDEVLSTFMAEVCQIVNARPVAGVPSDPYSPMPLSPAMILTLKTTHSVDSFQIEEFSPKDLYRCQWRCVQQLANRFWKRWRSEYLTQLNHRRKWQDDQRNLHEGDVVLLRDKTAHRSDWPMGVVVRTFPSEDSRVRKVDIRLGTDRKTFSRPSSELVLLVPND